MSSFDICNIPPGIDPVLVQLIRLLSTVPERTPEAEDNAINQVILWRWIFVIYMFLFINYCIVKFIYDPGSLPADDRYAYAAYYANPGINP